jgi:hypothetical protein
MAKMWGGPTGSTPVTIGTLSTKQGTLAPLEQGVVVAYGVEYTFTFTCYGWQEYEVRLSLYSSRYLFLESVPTARAFKSLIHVLGFL